MSKEGLEKLATEIQSYIQERAEEFLQGSENDETEREPPETGVCTAFFIVAEWMGSDGEKWLSYLRPDDQVHWLSRGILQEAINDL